MANDKDSSSSFDHQGRSSKSEVSKEDSQHSLPTTKVSPITSNNSSAPQELLYSPNNTSSSKGLGFPGMYPYLRGPYPTMYRGRLWTMRQYAGYGDAEQSNSRYHHLLNEGQTGLSVAFDLPTQMGLDSDHPNSIGEVGKVGVSIDTVEDMKILFNGIPLDKISTSMTINSTAMILLAMYIVVAEESGVPVESLRGTIQNDLLKEYIARGTYIFDIPSSMKIITDIFAYCSKNLPLFNSISISGYHIREAGATAEQELAFTIANGIEYVKTAIKAGLSVDSFAPRLSFFFSADNDFFEEIAKFRVARRIWSKTMRETFRVNNSKSEIMKMHVQTSGASLTAQQPLNNVPRVALQALSAILGGVQSLHTNSYDEALALPTEESSILALRTQQIIAEETGIPNTVDPLAGSYYLENLTDELEKKTLAILSIIEEKGGMAEAIKQGYPQQEIQDSAYKLQLDIEKKKTYKVGVNVFQEKEKIDIDLHKIDTDLERRQIERLEAVKARRDPVAAKTALDRLTKAAKDGNNLFPYVLDAVRGRASVGEISSALLQVYKPYSPASII